jgi:tungstate transport system ATP-binding protein
MAPFASLHNIKFQRGDDFCLAIDHLQLESGQIYLLEGTNGAGKSTFLHLLALLLLPSAGTIAFAGEEVREDEQRQRLRRQITLVEQQPYLFTTSVYQNLAFGLRLRDVRGELQDRRIRNALATVGLAGFEERHVRTLSGGESRRVALARAMVLRPQLLLLDEPTAGLDREVLPLFEDCLTTLPGQGTTVVIASHDGDQSRRLDGIVLTLEQGRLSPPPIFASSSLALEVH